ncbi:MAG: PadR family transcriptional regulator [Euzebya sp.]
MTRKRKPLPSASLHIVLALLDGELHGYEVMNRVAEISNGAVRMGPGTVYGTLNRLLDDGLIEETTDRVARADSERRRYYQLTAAGRAVAIDELSRLRRMVQGASRHLPDPATT